MLGLVGWGQGWGKGSGSRQSQVRTADSQQLVTLGELLNLTVLTILLCEVGMSMRVP